MIADFAHDYAIILIISSVLSLAWIIWFVIFTIEVYARLGDIRELLQELVDQN